MVYSIPDVFIWNKGGFFLFEAFFALRIKIRRRGEETSLFRRIFWKLFSAFAAVGTVVVFQHAILVKAGVKRIEILAVETIGGDAQPFAETLIVDDFTLPEKPERLENIRIIDQTKQIVVCGTGLLLWYDCVRTTKPRNRINTTFLFVQAFSGCAGVRTTIKQK